MSKMTYESPEAMGVPSSAIHSFISRLDKQGLPMHSVLLSRHGKIITEAYYAPYKADSLHRMFSITKSFTSIAIGLLIEEGKISLDSNIVDYFPDKLPKDVHPWIRELTIRDLLSMETCHSGTTYKSDLDSDWVESFFTTKPTHKPGTVFLYDTSASHTLCALVERLSGKPMLDYMRDKFLDEIGFSKEAYIIKDPFGVSMGGSGLMATPMDLMKFGLLIRNKGRLNGKELVPEWYINEATKHQTDNVLRGQVIEEAQGYGYQFWRTRHGGFACYGMGGQYIIFLPDQDLICVTTADTQDVKGGTQIIYDALYEEILPHLSDKAIAENPKDKEDLDELISGLRIKPVSGMITSPKSLDNNKVKYILEENQSGFTSFSLEISEEEARGTLKFTDAKGTHPIHFGLGKMVVEKFPIYNQRAATSGAFLNDNTLYIKSHIIDECIGCVHFQIVFNESNVTICMRKVEETYFNEFNGFLSGEDKNDD